MNWSRNHLKIPLANLNNVYLQAWALTLTGVYVPLSLSVNPRGARTRNNAEKKEGMLTKFKIADPKSHIPPTSDVHQIRLSIHTPCNLVSYIPWISYIHGISSYILWHITLHIWHMILHTMVIILHKWQIIDQNDRRPTGTTGLRFQPTEGKGPIVGMLRSLGEDQSQWDSPQIVRKGCCIPLLLKGKSTLAALENFGWLDIQIMDPQDQIGRKIFSAILH